MSAAENQAGWPYYEIVVKGQLDPHWSSWFEGLAIEALPGDKTCISGCISDQPALQGLLEQIFALNLQLISLQRYPRRPGSLSLRG